VFIFLSFFLSSFLLVTERGPLYLPSRMTQPWQCFIYFVLASCVCFSRRSRRQKVTSLVLSVDVTVIKVTAYEINDEGFILIKDSTVLFYFYLVFSILSSLFSSLSLLPYSIFSSLFVPSLLCSQVSSFIFSFVPPAPTLYVLHYLFFCFIYLFSYLRIYSAALYVSCFGRQVLCCTFRSVLLFYLYPLLIWGVLSRTSGT
jgi:hypothetical protein